MKNKFLFFIIILLAFVSCKSYRVKDIHFQNETKILNATVEKIDSTQNFYIYLIKNDTLKGVFSKPKKCNTNFGSKIILNKKYSLQTKINAVDKYEYLTRGQSTFPIEDGYFHYDEKVLFIEDCLNICGKTIR